MKDFESLTVISVECYCNVNPAWLTFILYIYAFSRHFYPKQLTVHSGYAIFVSMCVPWQLNPQPFALLLQCSTTEPQEYTCLNMFKND